MSKRKQQPPRERIETRGHQVIIMASYGYRTIWVDTLDADEALRTVYAMADEQGVSLAEFDVQAIPATQVTYR